jgi:Fur family peroxide stress response transcriptional regulator
MIRTKREKERSNMQQEANNIVNILKSKGLRVTHQRFAVYTNLLSRWDHPTAEQIMKDLNKHAPISSQATVYSSLQALCQVGLVREVLLEEGVCRYDAHVAAHHHFRCKSCGAIEDIPWEQFQNLNLQGLRSGLSIDGYEVILHGICDRCSGDLG